VKAKLWLADLAYRGEKLQSVHLLELNKRSTSYKTIAPIRGAMDRGLCIAGTGVVWVIQTLISKPLSNWHISIVSVTLCLDQFAPGQSTFSNSVDDSNKFITWR